MKRMFKLLGLAIILASTAYFVYFVYRTINEYDFSALVSVGHVSGIIICGILYALIIPVTAWAWQRLLSSVGCRYSLFELTLILGLTQPAKYLPGNIGQHIGRAAMAFNRGMPVNAFFGTVIVETLLAASAGLAVGVVCLGLSTSGFAALPEGARSTVLIAAIGLAIGVLLTPFLSRHLPALINRLLPLVGAPRVNVLVPERGAVVASTLAYVLNYLLIGLGLTILALLITPDRLPDLMLLTGAFAIAWLIGFFTPGAPAGLGVREGVMAALLGPTAGTHDALTIIIGLRLATVLGDGLALALGALLLARDRRRSVPATPESRQ